MTWFWAIAEGVTFLGLVCLLAVYTRRPVWVFGVFLVLTVWKLIRSVRKGGGIVGKRKILRRQDGSGREALILDKEAVEDIIMVLGKSEVPGYVGDSVMALYDFLKRHDKKFDKGLMLYAYNYPKGV